MADRTTTVNLRANVDQYKRALRDASQSTSAFSGQVDQLGAKGSARISDMTNGLVNVSNKTGLAAAGFAVLGVAVLKFAQTGIDAFTKLADQVDTYQDITGASAEESSQMVAVANALGVSTESLASGMARLSGNVSTNADALRANGVEIARNVDGSVDLNETLLNVADAYQRVGAGEAGNAVARAAFGRGYQGLIDILERSRSELEGFWKEAERSQQILSEDDLRIAREYEVATRQLEMAWQGLAVAGAETLLPVLTDVADALTTVSEIANNLPGGGLGNWISEIAGVASGSGKWGLILDLLNGDDSGGTGFKPQGLGQQAAAAVMALTDLNEEADPSAVLAYAEALEALAASAFAAAQASDDVIGDVGDLGERVRQAAENGDQFATSLDAATESGLANRRAIRDLATGVLEMATSLREQGASEAEVAGVTAAYRAELADTLTQLGFNREEVERYLGVLGLIPSSVNTDITLDASQAFDVLGKLQGAAWGVGSAFRQAMGLNPWAGDAAVNDALAGVGAIGGAIDPGNRTPSGGGSGVDEALKRRLAEDARMGRLAEFGGITVEEYKAYLNARIAATAAYSEEWAGLMHEVDRVNEDIGQGWRDAADQMEAMEDAWWEILSRQHEVGDISTQAYLEQLRRRLAGLQEFSDEWMATWREIQDMTDGGLVELIEAVEKQRQFDEAFYGLMEQRMLDNLRALDQPTVVVQGGSSRTFTYAPQQTIVSPDPARAGDSVNQRMRDDAFLQGL